MKIFLKIILVLIIALIVVVVLGAGYYGLVPGLSELMGANKAKDLGVTYTEQDLQTAYAKAQVEIKQLPPETPDANSIQFEGQHAVQTTFSEVELTAMLDSCHWKYCLLEDAQVQVQPDGTVEMSGVLQVDRLPGYAAALGSTDLNVIKVREGLQTYFKTNPALSVGARPEVNNGEVELNVTQFQIGRFSVPANLIEASRDAQNDWVEEFVAKVPGLSLDSVQFSDEGVQFDGSIPAVISSVQE